MYYYLTVNDDAANLTQLWDRKPIYFDEENEWSRGRSSLVNSAFLAWPGLREFAQSLGINPGAEGIAEVIVEIKRKEG